MNIFEILKDFIKKQFNKKALLQTGQIDEYAKRAESIDDISLIKQFYNKCSNELKDEIKNAPNDVYCSKLQTPISNEQLIRLTKAFFESIDLDYFNKINTILNNENPDFKLNISTSSDIENAVSNPNDKPLNINVRQYGDLRDIYGLVHELTHCLDIDKGDNSTRQLLGEIAPQCMERLLDDFLIKHTNSEKIDIDILFEDIEKRKYVTFLSRMKNAQHFCKLEDQKDKGIIPNRKNFRSRKRCQICFSTVRAESILQRS